MGLSFLISKLDREKIGQVELEVIAQTYTNVFQLTNCHVEISLISFEEIKEINKKYRNIDEATDVLSFPTFKSLSEIQLIPKEGIALLGSILICPEKAMIYQESLPQLVHHGLLHLLGYDHETDMLSWNMQEEKVITSYAEQNLIIPSITT